MGVGRKQEQLQNPADEKVAAEPGRPDFQEEDQGETTASPEAAWDEASLVTFSTDDPKNPLNWPKKVKWGITLAVSGTGFVHIMVSTVRHVCTRFDPPVEYL